MQPLDVDEPATVGPYRLLGRLGSGGMGRVYLGRSAGGRTVAVKIVHPHFALDEQFRARFQREVAAARRVGGAWTAPVLDADPDAAVPWVATAYAAGPSLAAAVSDTGPLPPHTVRALGAGLAEALTAVHELGLVHRDVKPSNVLLTLDGPLLIDFGIARAMDGTASLTSTGVSVGSPGYMAPEQILGKGATAAADVFSLGAVLAYAATGEPPFPGDSSAALLYKVVHEEPELHAMGGELRALAAACLTKDPASRPTPTEISHRLAPEGAARLVTGGWLPGALVEQVSRSAVQLLNLDTGEAVRSGPVPFESPAETESSVRGLGAGRGSGSVGFDRPGEMGSSVRGSGPVPVDTPAKTEPPASASAASATDAGAFGPPPAMNPAEPAPPPPGEPTVVPAQRDAPPPGRISVSMAAAATPVEGARGRRLSCTVVLAVAGALAAGTLGLGVLLRPWSHQDEDKGAGSAPSHSQAPTAASSTATGGTGAPDTSPTPGTIPARYLGTWQGQATALDGNLPIGTFRLTVHRAGVGEELGRLTQTDQLGGVCTDILTLKQVTGTNLVATSTGAKGNHGGCDPAAHQIELTPVGDDLKYTSDSSAEGNPVSRLSKVG
ncbi:serine/threonine protein kinase [Streptomyces fodineus]|uniref:Serine/threonine protein kinase n=1 Tax=Streptomyces fodineus TaxID=1904616 RepID=A0A1D7YB16_9ACTN|nr:serine/threonine-protein kinase [Streptomyces fodineus]AOR32752.1 serine/threonine protein kinase [Streptomyces fodineus]